MAHKIAKGREVPTRNVPVPRDASPELQAAIANAACVPQPLFNTVPATAEEWRALLQESNKSPSMQDALITVKKAFPAAVTSMKTAGVATFVITPPVIAPKFKNRLFIHVHGGGYVSGGGEHGTKEAMVLAHYAKMKVISIDYRMPPDHPAPAAVEDVTAVWREVIRTFKPGNVALGGASAGGGLALAAVMKFNELKLPLPGAVYAGTPWADLTNGGDSMAINDGLDSSLSGGNEWLQAAGHLYAGKHSVMDPSVSPLFGDFSHFPPAILVSGTRDCLLSDTVRVHRKLRAAGVDADLHVFEGISHGQYFTLHSAPESAEAYREIVAFLERHLGT